MTQRHAIDQALDLARMPALARSSVAPPIPSDILEIIRVAAVNLQDCQSAVMTTGEPAKVLVEAARFYLQHVLFRPDADSYRILGIEPTTSRATARSHLRWLLEWLHPDRNRDLDAVYAERVLKAWQDISAAKASPMRPVHFVHKPAADKEKRNGSASVRLPWIRLQNEYAKKQRRKSRRAFMVFAVPMSLTIACMTIWTIFYYFYLEPSAAIASFR
ncbi:MAG: J domain-containing protein [Bradyrhizobium sp.]